MRKQPRIPSKGPVLQKKAAASVFKAETQSSTGQRLQHAIALHQRGELNAARGLYEQLLRAYPAHSQVLYYYASLLLQQGEHARALALYQQLLPLAPSEAAASIHGNMGVALKALGRLDEALGQYEQALILRPEWADAWNNRGNALREMGSVDAALESYEKTISYKPDYFQAHLNRAALLRAALRWDEALAGFDRALALEPENIECRSLRADVLHQLHRDEAALEDLEFILARQPDNAEFLNNYGNCLLRCQRHEEALAAFARAEESTGKQPAVLANRGNALLQTGEKEAALACFDEAVALDPDYAPGHACRGNALRELNRYKEAAESFRRALALEPKAHFIYSSLAQMQADEGRPERALDGYNRALAIAPEDVSALCGRASILVKLGDEAAGLADIDMALLKSPDSPRVRIASAGLHRQVGQLERAVEDARLAIDRIWRGYQSLRTDPASLQDKSPAPMRVDNAGDALIDLHAFLSAQAVPYFIAYGTLLGIYRDGDLLPFDKDMDIGLPWHLDRKALIRMFEASTDFQLHKHSKDKPDEDLEWHFAVVHKQKNIAIDLFFFKPEADGNLLSGFHHRPVPLVWRFTPIETGSISYRGVDLPAPADPERFLADIYGPEWRVPDPYFDSVVSGRSLDASCRDISRVYGYLRLFKQMNHRAWNKAYGYCHQLLTYDNDSWLNELGEWLKATAARRESLPLNACEEK